jgi:hypothetical protein
VTRENHVAKATLPGLGTAHGITTQQTTRRLTDGTVVVRSRSHINRVVLGSSSDVGTIEIENLTSVGTSSHDSDGYHASHHSSVSRLAYTDPMGTTQELELPTPGQPVVVPELASIELGVDRSGHSSDGAHSNGYALRVQFIPAGTKVLLAHANTVLVPGVTHGLFRGHSSAVEGTAAQDNLSVGPQPLSKIPCQGTGGELRSKDLAGLELDGGLVLQGLRSTQMGDQNSDAAFGSATGKVAGVDLGGQIQVGLIRGVANVRRTTNGVTADTHGTEIGTVTVNGETQAFPPSDVIEVPGVAKLERRLVERSKDGISVVALRITLLDGSGAVVDLGNASLRIKKAD